VPLSTDKTKIIDGNNEPITLSCANWSGAQGTTFVAGGLDKAPVDFIAKTIASLGFNCVRIPYSLQAYWSNPVVADKDVAKNPSFKGLTSMLVFDQVVKACTDNGLMVIINNHVSNAGKCCSTSDGNGMWYNKDYPAEKFFTAVKDMTLRYRANSMVVGNDLRNELRPDETHGLMPTWGSGNEANDWRMAAEKAGNEVLKYNSRSLVFVQGISFANNLRNVKDKPLTL
jgi:endoglucanase